MVEVGTGGVQSVLRAVAVGTGGMGGGRAVLKVVAVGAGSASGRWAVLRAVVVCVGCVYSPWATAVAMDTAAWAARKLLPRGAAAAWSRRGVGPPPSGATAAWGHCRVRRCRVGPRPRGAAAAWVVQGAGGTACTFWPLLSVKYL